MDGAKPYHHGDLRAALLTAAEAELEASGLEGFSLRKVARRAGVSHAAPAHHFGDINGLLTALAARGYARLLELSDARDALGTGEARERLTDLCLAYCDFAREHKALFRLCFSSTKPDHEAEVLKDVADRAFMRLSDRVRALDGSEWDWSVDGMQRTYFCWALCHGIADLLASDRLKLVADLPPQARDDAIRGLLEAKMPDATPAQGG